MFKECFIILKCLCLYLHLHILVTPQRTCNEFNATTNEKCLSEILWKHGILLLFSMPLSYLLFNSSFNTENQYYCNCECNTIIWPYSGVLQRKFTLNCWNCDRHAVINGQYSLLFSTVLCWSSQIISLFSKSNAHKNNWMWVISYRW